MGFWHASDDIVADGRQVPRDLASPPTPSTRPKNYQGLMLVALSQRLSLRTVLCQINVHPGGCSVETALSDERLPVLRDKVRMGMSE